jgi:hypothetical protein
MITFAAIVSALLIIFVLYFIVEDAFLDIDEQYEEEQVFTEEEYVEMLSRRYYDNQS